MLQTRIPDSARTQALLCIIQDALYIQNTGSSTANALIPGECYCIVKQAVQLQTRMRHMTREAQWETVIHMADTGLWGTGTHAALPWDAKVRLYKILRKASCPPWYLFSLSWAREGYAGVCSTSTTALFTPREWTGMKQSGKERAAQEQQRGSAARFNGQEVEGIVCICRAAKASEKRYVLKLLMLSLG